MRFAGYLDNGFSVGVKSERNTVVAATVCKERTVSVCFAFEARFDREGAAGKDWQFSLSVVASRKGDAYGWFGYLLCV